MSDAAPSPPEGSPAQAAQNGGPAERTARTPPKRFSTQIQLVLLATVGAVGGFLFGYDTGVISGALPYIRDDEILESYTHSRHDLTWIQECIVSSAIFTAVAGAMLGGRLSDLSGRKRTLLFSNALFTSGALLMAAAQDAYALIAGRAVVGVGIGMASAATPVFLAECAPVRMRGRMVTLNVLAITLGQFVAYAGDWAFTFAPGTWRWMLGVAAVPAVMQSVGLSLLHESPRWLAMHGHKAEAAAAAAAVHDAGRDLDEVYAELRKDAERSAAHRTSGKRPGLLKMLGRPEVRLELALGVGLQVLQQLLGINTVMYYTPAILQLAGFHDKRSALLLGMVPAGVNALFTLVGVRLIDKSGRRPLLLYSMAGVCVALVALGGVFHAAELHSPGVVAVLSGISTSTCPVTAADCTGCLAAGVACSFCGLKDSPMEPGICVASDDVQEACEASDLATFSIGCPSEYTTGIIACLVLYLMAFAPGVGPVPWAINAEIYPLSMRGAGAGAASTANWITNAIVSQTFLTIIDLLQPSGAFWLYALISAFGTVLMYTVMPETHGRSFDEVQAMFREYAGVTEEMAAMYEEEDSGRGEYVVVPMGH